MTQKLNKERRARTFLSGRVGKYKDGNAAENGMKLRMCLKP